MKYNTVIWNVVIEDGNDHWNKFKEYWIRTPSFQRAAVTAMNLARKAHRERWDEDGKLRVGSISIAGSIDAEAK